MYVNIFMRSFLTYSSMLLTLLGMYSLLMPGFNLFRDVLKHAFNPFRDVGTHYSSLLLTLLGINSSMHSALSGTN